MLKLSGAVLLLSSCAVLIGWPGSLRATLAAAAKATRVLSVSALALALGLGRAYEDNEVAADNIYKDRVLLVSGTIFAVGTNFIGKTTLSLNAGDDLMNVAAPLEDSERAKAAHLLKGTIVVVRCTCTGRFEGLPNLKNCTTRS